MGVRGTLELVIKLIYFCTPLQHVPRRITPLQIASNSWTLGMLDVTSIAEFISHQIARKEDYERRSEEYGKGTIVAYFTRSGRTDATDYRYLLSRSLHTLKRIESRRSRQQRLVFMCQLHRTTSFACELHCTRNNHTFTTHDQTRWTVQKRWEGRGRQKPWGIVYVLNGSNEWMEARFFIRTEHGINIGILHLQYRNKLQMETSIPAC